jgi:hypothetical protein
MLTDCTAAHKLARMVAHETDTIDSDQLLPEARAMAQTPHQEVDW